MVVVLRPFYDFFPLQDWCRLCHCYDCYRQYQEHDQLKDGQDVLKRAFDGSMIPWTDEWFEQMVQFRKQCFWECHAETTIVDEAAAAANNRN